MQPSETTGLTPDEERVMDDLTSCYRRFLSLPHDHAEEVDRFRQHVAGMAGIVARRSLGRYFPDFWPAVLDASPVLRTTPPEQEPTEEPTDETPPDEWTSEDAHAETEQFVRDAEHMRRDGAGLGEIKQRFLEFTDQWPSEDRRTAWDRVGRWSRGEEAPDMSLQPSQSAYDWNRPAKA
jgi:hypothetical protein